jgi:AcrR family transcriptional regulator
LNGRCRWGAPCGWPDAEPARWWWASPMPRVIDGETRTDDIIRAVGRIIFTRGIEALTLRNIAREVGISAGSLHHHDESRDRLVRVAVHWFARTSSATTRSADELRNRPGCSRRCRRPPAHPDVACVHGAGPHRRRYRSEDRRGVRRGALAPRHQRHTRSRRDSCDRGPRPARRPPSALCARQGAITLDTARAILTAAVTRTRAAGQTGYS